MEIWQWVLTISGGIITLGSALTTIKNVAKPATDLIDRVKRLEVHDTKDIERFGEIDKRFCEQEETNQAILKGLVALINHELDGNSAEGLRKTRNALLTQIIER